MLTLAQADPRLQGTLLLLVIGLIALLGLLTIILLLVMWRRFNARLRTRQENEPSSEADPWTAAGQRLAAPDDEESDDDEDDQDKPESKS